MIKELQFDASLRIDVRLCIMRECEEIANNWRISKVRLCYDEHEEIAITHPFSHRERK